MLSGRQLCGVPLGGKRMPVIHATSGSHPAKHRPSAKVSIIETVRQ